MPQYDWRCPFKVSIYPIAICDLRHGLRGDLIPERVDLSEGFCETTGRDDLEDTCRHVTRIPERMPPPSRLEDQCYPLVELLVALTLLSIAIIPMVAKFDISERGGLPRRGRLPRRGAEE